MLLFVDDVTYKLYPVVEQHLSRHCNSNIALCPIENHCFACGHRCTCMLVGQDKSAAKTSLN